MIACVSPAYSSSNHTINTLRYSDRLKEKKLSNIVLSNNKKELIQDIYSNIKEDNNQINFGALNMEVKFFNYIYSSMNQ
jgi:kinesin family protein 2/24